MIGIVAKLKIKEGSGSDFEAIATQLVEKVNANEEGVVYYDLFKEDDTTYVFLEKYKDTKYFNMVRYGTYHAAIPCKHALEYGKHWFLGTPGLRIRPKRSGSSFL